MAEKEFTTLDEQMAMIAALSSTALGHLQKSFQASKSVPDTSRTLRIE